MIEFPALERLDGAIRAVFPKAVVMLRPIWFGDIVGGHVAQITDEGEIMIDDPTALRALTEDLPKSVCLQFGAEEKGEDDGFV